MQLKTKAAANNKAAVKYLADNTPKYEGMAGLRVMAVRSLDLGKLRTYF